MPGLFDVYQCVIISVDYVLFGISKDVLEACIRCMKQSKMLKFEELTVESRKIFCAHFGLN